MDEAAPHVAGARGSSGRSPHRRGDAGPGRGRAVIAVVVPAHNEEELLPHALSAIGRAARHPALKRQRVVTIVALDGCCDGSADIARRAGALLVRTPGCNVGAARAAGADLALAAGARWLAFTDADSTVAPDWLVSQLALDSDAVCGTIHVRDWGRNAQMLRRQHEAAYRDADDHRHVHGANLGVSARAYRLAGGFQPHASGEDVALIESLQRVGARIAWSARPRVVTSARRQPRAPGGFGERLAQVEKQLAGPALAPAAP